MPTGRARDDLMLSRFTPPTPSSTPTENAVPGRTDAYSMALNLLGTAASGSPSQRRCGQAMASRPTSNASSSAAASSSPWRSVVAAEPIRSATTNAIDWAEQEADEARCCSSALRRLVSTATVASSTTGLAAAIRAKSKIRDAGVAHAVWRRSAVEGCRRPGVVDGLGLLLQARELALGVLDQKVSHVVAEAPLDDDSAARRGPPGSGEGVGGQEPAALPQRIRDVEHRVVFDLGLQREGEDRQLVTLVTSSNGPSSSIRADRLVATSRVALHLAIAVEPEPEEVVVLRDDL